MLFLVMKGLVYFVYVVIVDVNGGCCLKLNFERIIFGCVMDFIYMMC